MEGHESTQSGSKNKCCSHWKFGDFVILFTNFISLIWGIYCLGGHSITFSPFTKVSFYFLLTFLPIGSAFVFSLALTLFLILLNLIVCRKHEAKSMFGCLPILYFGFLYTSYIANLIMSLIILDGKAGRKLQPAMYWYVVFQLTVCLTLVLHTIYSVFCKRSSISRHLQEIEQDTFHVEKDEIEKYRNEVRKQVAVYEDKLRVKVPFLTKTQTEMVTIESGQFQAAKVEHGLKIYKPPLDVDNPVPDSTKNKQILNLVNDSNSEKRAKSPLKLYKK